MALLLASHPKPNLAATDSVGNSALHLAFNLGFVDLIPLLVNAGAGLEARDAAGNTALHLAFNLGFVDLIPLLINAGANLEAKDAAGNTALLRAVRLDTEQRLDLVSLMLERAERPAVIDAANSDGDNALHLVARLGDNPQIHELATLLLDRGIDGLAMNAQGKKPEKVAFKAGNGILANLIARKNIDLAAIRVLQQCRVITDQQIAGFVSSGRRETIPEGTPPTYAAMIGRCWDQRAESRPRIEEVTQELEQHRGEALPIPEAYLCPITGEIMREPVMDRDGHTFERVAIERWVRDHHNCPNSRVPLELTDLAPNRALRDLIEEFLTANPPLRPASCSAAAPSPAAPAP